MVAVDVVLPRKGSERGVGLPPPVAPGRFDAFCMGSLVTNGYGGAIKLFAFCLVVWLSDIAVDALFVLCILLDRTLLNLIYHLFFHSDLNAISLAPHNTCMDGCYLLQEIG